MRKSGMSVRYRKVLFLLLTVLSVTLLRAQITITSPVPGTLTTHSASAPGAIVFGVRNSNATPIIITDISNYVPVGFSGSFSLWYHTTAITGAPVAINAVNGWVKVVDATNSAPATSGITPIFTGLNISIPANTTYRFAIAGPNGSPSYGGTGSTPNKYEGGGVEVYVQNNANSPGYGGAYPGPPASTPSSFIGSITFQPTVTCTDPPIPGTAVSSASSICEGRNFNLNVINGSIGTGQTYRWQSSPDNSTWTNIGTSSSSSGYITSLTDTTYYRAAVTCGANTSYSSSVKVAKTPKVSGTFTINSASATGGGNFRTFNEAVASLLTCGIDGPVVFNVTSGSGPYNEQVIIPAINGASSINTITFNGNGATLTYASGNTAERATIKLNGADYVTINDLTIIATGTYGYGVQLLNDADYNTVNNCTITVDKTSTASNFGGIVVSSNPNTPNGTGTPKCDYNTFSNNTISGGLCGISLVCTYPESNGNNKIIKNVIKDFYNYGLYVDGSFNLLIDSNTISRPTRTTVGDFYGIYFVNISSKARVSRNTITNPFGAVPNNIGSAFYGIFFNGVASLATFENMVSNNRIYNLTGNGNAIGIQSSASNNVWFYHNTISMDGPAAAGAASHFTRGFYQFSNADGLEFKNNIITISRGGLSVKTAIYVNTNSKSVNMVSDRNDFYISSTTGTNTLGYWNAFLSTVASWRSATGLDGNSISSDPFYTDLANGDLKPKNASIDNLGAAVGITNDYSNTVRSTTTPDIGAYEFTPVVCTTPPVTGTIAVSETPVCGETPVMLTATGNSYGIGQIFQWQAATSATGTYTNFGPAVRNPDTAIVAPAISTYFRLAVTCSGQTSYSAPVFLTVTQPLAGGEYTINKNQPASTTNFVSFADVKNAMTCGISGPVVFNVVSSSGPYNEQLILNHMRGTSATNTITFNGNGNTIKYNSTVDNERAVIKLNGTDHVILDSFIVDATGTAAFGWGIHLLNNADSNTISRCIVNLDKAVTTSNAAGIVINSSHNSLGGLGISLCDSNTIVNNTINGGYNGITVVGGTNSFLYNNKIVNNKIYDSYAVGISIAQTANTLIEGNDIARPTRMNTAPTGMFSIYANQISEGVRISKNRVHNLFDQMTGSNFPAYGIFFSSADASANNINSVTNNLIYNFNGSGPMIGIYNGGSDNVVYYHNTISLDNAANTSTYLTQGFYQTTDAEGIVLKNNLFTITRGGTGLKHGLYFNTATTRFVSDNNDIYMAPGSSSFVGYLAGNKVTLDDWRSASGKDLNSAAVDPLYSSPATENFKPMSPILDNRGTGVNITTDIEGVTRPASSPDIGAYEFTVPACTTPPAAGTATASLPSACLGNSVLLSLTGNTFGSGMSFQWEYAASASGTYLPLGAPKAFPDTVIEASTTQYYRAAVTCSGNTQYSTPVLVSLNPAFSEGVYTIDPAQPVSATNFQSFTKAVEALECGITGPVTFKVAPGTYTEQVRMHKIGGASNNSRVTFQSDNGNAASVVLQFNATTATKNYVLQLDSASYVTYKDMTLTALHTTNGRVIELANSASYDSLVNLVINAPVNATTATTVAGIYANNLRGGNNVIKGNTITNGSNGIYLRGISENNLSASNSIEDNTINAPYNYGIQANYTSRIKISNNTVTVASSTSAAIFGIFAGYSDTAYQVVGNKVTFSNTTGAVHGIAINNCDGTPQERGRVAGNTVLATNNNTGTMYGLENQYSTYNNTVNNVVSIKTTDAYSYALFSNLDDNVNYYNNSIYSASTSVSSNIAGYFFHLKNKVDVRNNIFAHFGGGTAIYTYDPSNTTSDYNMLYTSGTSLVGVGAPVAANFSTLKAWRDTYGWDQNSIVYKPAFISDVDLRPDAANPEVWAMHGRGVQIAGNDYDFNNAPRSTTLTAGVPDLGAYEFVPTSTPPVLTALPATPVAGGTQTFMMGTDTVSKITWGATVPTSISMRRYSGILPPGLTPATPHMYYYTEVETTGASAGFSKKDFFIDPWQGWINHQYQIRLGRTDATINWIVGSNSTVDTMSNVIAENALIDLYRFTGIADINAIPPPPSVITQQIDSSNMGKRFWVGNARNFSFLSNGDGTLNKQEMVLYLRAGADPATVTVKVNGVNWVRTYTIPANTTIVSDKLPKAGFYDSRLINEGKSDRGISIESDMPIAAYTHMYDPNSSAATMLLPVGTYGYEYYTINGRQRYYGLSDAHSTFIVVADRDNTTVEITPSNPTHGGRPANVPFLVTLNRGEVYQVLGAYILNTRGYDLTGSKIISVPNTDGKCYPFAVFAGSSFTQAGCGTADGDGGDVLFQQVIPTKAWGTRYLTVPTAAAVSANNALTNIYRVMVKDPQTVVKMNGSILTGLVDNRYYHFESNTADYIEADQPVMVAQYMPSSNSTYSSCAGSTSFYDGDPEIFYLSPLGKGIKNAGFYRPSTNDIKVHYLALTIPTNGLGSLTVDGSNVFDNVYAHPNFPGYSVVVKRWDNVYGQSMVKSDSAFTGIIYGEGFRESYGYNLGMLLPNPKNLDATPELYFTNTYNSTGTKNDFTCVKAPFKVTMLVPVKPNSITWSFSKVTGITPNADTTVSNPVAIDSVVINNIKYYKYELNQEYSFTNTGLFSVPVSFTHPEFESCNNFVETALTINVMATPVADFDVNFTNCIGDAAKYTGNVSAGYNVAQWNWNLGDGTTATVQSPTKQYSAPGTYNVNMKLKTLEGCVGDTTKKVVVNARPTVEVVKDSLSSCKGSSVTFTVKNPTTAVTYNWYTAVTGGTLLGTGTNFTTTVNAITDYYVEAVSAGCSSTSRQKVTATPLPDLTTPVVTIDSASVNMIRFKWNIVPGATSYEVSEDGGNTWGEPSSNNYTHTISGLRPLQAVTLAVRAKGGCKDMQSLNVSAKAQVDQIYIPNSFSPNSDGMNDVLQVYGYVVKDMQFIVFNQWGEKIYESKDQKRAWDGTHKGKLQPSGVYMYVCKLTLNDGSVVTRKGSINLVH